METDLLILLIFFYIPNTKCLTENLGLNSKEIIQKYGYPLEIYSIQTDDGYILETFRIPYGKGNATIRSRQPVLLMPGTLGSAASYVNFGPENSLGFILADNGYDVWLANNRGTQWSRKHKTLDPVLNKKEFFDFSFQEFGLFDVKAIIDYILDITNQKSLFYIGYSLGTTSFFALTSTRLEYNNKIILMVAMGPIAYVSNIQFALVPFAKRYFKEIQEATERYGIYELQLHSPTITCLAETFCQDSATTQSICSFIAYFIAGYSPHLNKTMLPVIFSEFSSAPSVRTFFHYIQLIISERFEMYDFGAVENVKRYGQQTPPLFNVSEISAPVALYYGGADLISTRRDVEQLARELPNVVKRKFIKSYNHFDFLYSVSSRKWLLYRRIISAMKEYSK